MRVIKADADLFLDDFEAEARAHIEKIEAFFLDAGTLAGDPDQLNGVFRTAHSLKGTAGFFSLEKIVAVAHELESVFSQIKDGKLNINDEITDIVLQSVDCLRDLVDNIHSAENVDIKDIIEILKKYSKAKSPESKTKVKAEEIHTPFDYKNPETEKALKNAARYGHKAYYVNINFNRGLGKYYKHPAGMFDNIFSIGSIIEAIVNGQTDEIIRNQEPSEATAQIINALSLRDTSTLELLVTSVLEFELFSIAIEINKKDIHLLSKESVLGMKSDEKPAKQEDIRKDGEKAEPPKTKMQTEQAPGRLPAQETNFLIHLDISVINGLLDLANEMILARNQLLSTTSDYKKSITGLTPVLHDINRLTSEIQEKIMLTRMQPINVIFSKFPRIIRDTSKVLNKDIGIEILGGDVTLDKYLLDALTDPITQLVKNSADHGVEPAERRAELGKPQKGKITLNAYMRDGSAIIEVTDDGAGIDMEALKQKALERGVVTEEMFSAMTNSEIFALILEPGFSTAKQVTNLSGRGVGMDIVKTNIEKLSGSIEIESEADKGTTMRLRMPLTLSAVRALIVTINGVQYAVPEINVERIVRIWRAIPSRRLERVRDTLVLSLNGRVIPVVTMEEIDAKAKGLEPPQIAVLLQRSLERDVIKCLVLKAGNRNFALLIDDANDTEQTLVKPLPHYFKNCLCYSNVTVLGNGNAITILDAEGILRLMGIEGAPQEIVSENDEKEGVTKEKQYIIFQCSGTEYFALETSEISRIEQIDTGKIQEIGDGYYINIASETIRIIRPEDFAPVKKLSYDGDKLYLLTLKNSVSPVGLLAGKLLDKVEAAFKLDNDQIRSDFIFGTGVLNEKIIIFLNPEAILNAINNFF